MNPIDSQGQNQLTPDQTAATLAFATHQMSQRLPQDQTPEPAPQPPTNQTNTSDTQAQMQGLETRIMDELGALKEEIKQVAANDSGKEINDLKTKIEAILNSNE